MSSAELNLGARLAFSFLRVHSLLSPLTLRRMPQLHQLVDYGNDLLRVGEIADWPNALNGLQIENSGTVTRIGAAVDAGVVPFQKAAAAGIDFLIVHHGMYWDMPRPLTGPAYERVATLMHDNCALYSNHLPLDGHPEIGNNALLARQLGLKRSRPFLVRDGEAIGCIANSKLTRAAIRKKLESLYPRVIAIEFGSDAPREVAVGEHAQARYWAVNAAIRS